MVRLSVAVALCTFSLNGLAVLPALAQGSDADAVNASVTVVPEINVAGLQDLLFGTHFASEGVVENEQDAEWFITGPPGTTVDLAFSILPATLADGVGNTVPVVYGTESMNVVCDDGTGNTPNLFTDPAVGFTGCLLPSGGTALVELGLPGQTFDGAASVDLTGAPSGTYTAVVELTATVN